MKIKNIKKWIVLYVIFFAVVVILGCGNKEEKNKDDAGQTQTQSITPDSISGQNEANTEDILVSVDGKYLKKSKLAKEIKELMDVYKDQIPKDKTKDIQANIKKQLIENFIIRTVLENEIEKRNIQANEKEINESKEQIISGLPPGRNFADFLKESRLTREEFNENIAFTIKVKQLVQVDFGNKVKPSANEIRNFYNENKDKFIVPESVHVRHVLVVIEEGDDEKIKAEKKTKIENIHKQLSDGADFAEVARKNSDCPSKENGGDLGIIKKGETVKQFEDAAFSQEKNVIGPVVTTEYGHHIIQVIEHNKAKTTTMAESKTRISNYLEQQKQLDAFNSLVKKLRENAKILIYKN